MRPASVLSAAGLSLVAALGLGLVHPFGNPRAIPAESRMELLRGASMPGRAREVLINKCADCHSDATHWPFYAYVAPVSWLTEHDIAEGRRRMNLSHWLALSDDERETLSIEIVRQARRRAMPLLPYRLIHPGSGLTYDDVAALLLLAPEAGSDAGVVAGDAVHGRAVFEKRCTGCHDLDLNLEGPHLRGVYGRRAGAVSGFTYSSALGRSGLTWTDANLERWLRDSDAMLPESNMGFSVPKAQDRADVIAFLKAQR